MAYNLQTLITILQQILNPERSRWINFQNKPEIESLLKKAESLQLILKKSSLPKIESLENQIRDAAHKAEDILESHMVDQVLSVHPRTRFTFSPPFLQQVSRKLDSAMEQVLKLREGMKKISRGSSSSGASFSSSNSIVVGVDEDLLQLKDRLTGMQSKLEVIPIVGMGGIGKTTLARKLYQDPLILSHFKFRAWTTISQDYDMKAILSGLLRCIIGKEFDKYIEEKVDDLKDILYRSLYGRKYMIVLDDIWSTKFWDEVRMYFPDNNNGSRILITTRESDVAKYADSKSLEHQVHLLNQSKSWNLLRQLVFGEEDCPFELQGVGRKIAGDCGGLPLAINVIGGLLSKLERSIYVWVNIGNDVRVAIAKSDEQFSSILSLSYNHLSNHLKPCFLYMGAFPEDYEIKSSRLIHMWVAEGFLNSNGNKSLEEEGDDYLKSLVERNLLLVKELKRNGKPKRFSMHDLLRDLCISKASEDMFLHVKHASNVVTPNNLRRVSFHAPYHPNPVHDSTTTMPRARVRSFLSTSRYTLSPELFAFKLLRVLDILEMSFLYFPAEILQLVNLRYLAFDCHSSLPIGISRLWNLQTLIARLLSGDMPCEIWNMSEMRHIKLINKVQVVFEEEDPMKKHVLKKLQTLSSVGVYKSPMWKDFFRRFPNMKKLAIFYAEESGGPLDLSHLHKLEKLRCDFKNCGVLSTLRFPSHLRDLTLRNGSIYSRDLTTLCALPNLEALIIDNCIFGSIEENKDEEWELGEDDEFRSLRFLHLNAYNLARWRADETNFPRLRHLYIKYCSQLEEIPGGIGEIPTLQLIELYDCTGAVIASAQHIQEFQQSEFDNYAIQVIVHDG